MKEEKQQLEWLRRQISSNNWQGILVYCQNNELCPRALELLNKSDLPQEFNHIWDEVAAREVNCSSPHVKRFLVENYPQILVKAIINNKDTFYGLNKVYELNKGEELQVFYKNVDNLVDYLQKDCRGLHEETQEYLAQRETYSAFICSAFIIMLSDKKWKNPLRSVKAFRLVLEKVNIFNHNIDFSNVVQFPPQIERMLIEAKCSDEVLKNKEITAYVLNHRLHRSSVVAFVRFFFNIGYGSYASSCFYEPLPESELRKLYDLNGALVVYWRKIGDLPEQTMLHLWRSDSDIWSEVAKSPNSMSQSMLDVLFMNMEQDHIIKWLDIVMLENSLDKKLRRKILRPSPSGMKSFLGREECAESIKMFKEVYPFWKNFWYYIRVYLS